MAEEFLEGKLPWFMGGFAQTELTHRSSDCLFLVFSRFFVSHFYTIFNVYEVYLSIVDFFHFILGTSAVKDAIKQIFDWDILNPEAIQLWSGMLQLEMSILDVWNYYTFASWPLEQNLSWEGNTKIFLEVNNKGKQENIEG